MKNRHLLPDGSTVIFRAFITLPNGKRLYAWERGKRAFRLVVKDERVA